MRIEYGGDELTNHWCILETGPAAESVGGLGVERKKFYSDESTCGGHRAISAKVTKRTPGQD